MTVTLNIIDVRAEMPNYEAYKDWDRQAEILGIALHHSATADRQTGAPMGDAYSLFRYQVEQQGRRHGGFNYIITGEGIIHYALDEKIAAYHAGFDDPDDVTNLEHGQFWNNHYLAICLTGWFSNQRTYQDGQGLHFIPDQDTRPRQAQLDALLALVRHLQEKHHIPTENVRAHRELTGNITQCPGLNLDPAQIRQRLREQPPLPPRPPTPNPGEHALVLTDTDAYLDAALAYIWHFSPDVSFAPPTAIEKWRYLTAVGPVGDDLLAAYRLQGAQVVDHIAGDPAAVRAQLDALRTADQRFRSSALPPRPAPDAPHEYTVQLGDTLPKIAHHFYGQANLWRRIFHANRDQLSDPRQVQVGIGLMIPSGNK